MLLSIILLSVFSLTTSILLLITYTKYRLAKINGEYFTRRCRELVDTINDGVVHRLKVGTKFEIPHNNRFDRGFWGKCGEVVLINGGTFEVRFDYWRDQIYVIDITKAHLLIIQDTPNKLKHKFS